MANRLRTNLALNGLTKRVEIAEVALGATDGVAELNLVDSSLGRSSLCSVESVRSVPVTVRPLVQYLWEQSKEFDAFVIEIDVKGCEYEVLIPFLSAVSRESIPNAVLLETHHAMVVRGRGGRIAAAGLRALL